MGALSWEEAEKDSEENDHNRTIIQVGNCSRGPPAWSLNELIHNHPEDIQTRRGQLSKELFAAFSPSHLTPLHKREKWSPERSSRKNRLCLPHQ